MNIQHLIATKGYPRLIWTAHQTHKNKLELEPTVHVLNKSIAHSTL